MDSKTSNKCNIISTFKDRILHTATNVFVDLHPLCKINKSIKDASGDFSRFSGEIIQTHKEFDEMINKNKDTGKLFINSGYESNHFINWLDGNIRNVEAILTDPISTSLEWKEIPYSLNDAIGSLSDLLYKVKNIENLKIIKLDGSLIYDSGGNVLTEICYVLSLANQYVQLLRKSGHLIKDIFNRFCIVINSDIESLYKINILLECWKGLEFFWGLNENSSPMILLKITQERNSSIFENNTDELTCNELSEHLNFNNLYFDIKRIKLRCNCNNGKKVEHKNIFLDNEIVWNEYIRWQENGGLLNLITNKYLSNEINFCRNREINKRLREIMISEGTIEKIILNDDSFESFYNRVKMLEDEQTTPYKPQKSKFDLINTTIYTNIYRKGYFYNIDEFILDHYKQEPQNFSVGITYNSIDELAEKQAENLYKILKACQIQTHIVSDYNTFNNYDYVFVCSGMSKIDELIDRILLLKLNIPTYFYGIVSNEEVFNKISKYFTGYISENAEVEEIITIMRFIFCIY